MNKNLFSGINSSFTTKKAFLFGDGGSRGNPGIAGCGGVIFDKDKKEIIRFKKFLGHQTNNYAEYMSLILGLEESLKLQITDLEVFMDSKLVIEQMNGNWKIKHPQIKILWEKAKNLCENFNTVKFTHIRREKNKIADQMANKAMDEKNNY